jgi:hypothetical protein
MVDSFMLEVRDSLSLVQGSGDSQMYVPTRQAGSGESHLPRLLQVRLNHHIPAASKVLRRCGNLLLTLALGAALPLGARDKDKLPYGEGLIVNIPLPESEVVQVIEDIAQNGLIRGTKEYNKDEFVSGAIAAKSSRVFGEWTEGGKVFYKVRDQALDPRNFKDSNDVGTLAVRYVVQPQGEKNTILRINALFQEDFRHATHQSDGSVETAEYKDIQEHLEAIEVMKSQTVEAQDERKEQLARKQRAALLNEAQPFPTESSSSVSSETVRASASGSQNSAEQLQHAAEPSMRQEAEATVQQPAAVSPPEQTQAAPVLAGQALEQHVKDLRKQLARLVKAPGAPLKSAPFHTASTLLSLTPGTEILILISTPYWYGVETHDGQHGWLMRDQLEQP